ncbi:VOC family protein [Prauserella cavernicola]|uniref:VOC family protein n=1 Tax=Prauserella cavernicola TaxID=2800127 RepID=A0A934V2Q2_9PSEU|nr:VOC family protein [Prauserella cavernicola]MBK1786266.1 VOC family protein [Prauserella cavernicola]
MARIRDVVFDCRHAASLARFWAAALDEHRVAPYDDAELERLRGLGITSTEDDPTVLVEPPQRTRPRLFFNTVPESRSVKNRVHLDLDTDDLDAEVARLTALGATVLTEHEGHVVLADPEGNEFCVME